VKNGKETSKVIDAILDTNIIIDILRELPIAVQWFRSQGAKRLAITPIVWLEALQGTSNKVERDKTFRLLQEFQTEYMLRDDQQWAMNQFMQFHLSHNVGYEDCLIASIAVRLDVPLYTRNVKHFAPLPDVAEMQPY